MDQVSVFALFVGVPVVLFLGIAALPGRKSALFGAVAIVLATAAAWATPGVTSMMAAIAPLAIAGAVIAVAVQLLRPALAQDGATRGYPMLVGLCSLGFGYMIWNVLGI